MMEKTNQDYANAIINALKEGLIDVVLRAYTDEYGGSYWQEVGKLTNKRYKRTNLDYVKKQLDPLELLELIKKNARLFEVQKKQDPKLIDYTMKLTQLRNGGSHWSDENEEKLTDGLLVEQALLATRLLEAFDTKETRQAADVTRKIREIFLARIEGETDDEATIPGEPQGSVASASRATRDENNPEASAVPHSERHMVQELLRQNDNLMQQMQGMQRQQASQLKTATSANAETMQQLIRHNQELMKQMQDNPSGRRRHSDDSLIQSLMQQNQAMMQLVQLVQVQPPASQPVINVDTTISPNVSGEITNSSAAPAIVAERNDAAFVLGVIVGLLGFMGVAHIFNHKLLRGLIYLVVGSVLYWILLLVLAAILNTLKIPLLLLFVAHVAIVWQSAKHGARRRQSDTKAKRATS